MGGSQSTSSSVGVYSQCDNNLHSSTSDSKLKSVDASQLSGMDMSSGGEGPPTLQRPLSFEEKVWQKVSSVSFTSHSSREVDIVGLDKTTSSCIPFGFLGVSTTTHPQVHPFTCALHSPLPFNSYTLHSLPVQIRATGPHWMCSNCILFSIGDQIIPTAGSAESPKNDETPCGGTIRNLSYVHDLPWPRTDQF
jgi:hypothetical protein